jgi:hypothetical protein
MYVIRNDKVIESQVYLVSTNVDINISKLDQGSLQVDYTDAGGATAIEFVAADVDVDDNTITQEAHGLLTGQRVAATTDGTLPAPLTATNYYVIKVDADTIKLATTQANALAGTAINISDDGSVGATHTLTPAALAATVTLYVSNDGVTFQLYASSIASGAITAAGGKLFDLTDKLNFAWLRIATAVTTGAIGVNARLYGKALKD